MHNKALLLKQVHTFLNKENIPWVNIIWESYYQTSLPEERMVGSFWWRTLLKLLPIYKEFDVSSAYSSNTTLFWSHCWWDQPLQNKFPELSSFKNSSTISLQKILNSVELATHFHTPLSQQAFLQFNMLQEFLQERSKGKEMMDCQ